MKKQEESEQEKEGRLKEQKRIMEIIDSLDWIQIFDPKTVRYNDNLDIPIIQLLIDSEELKQRIIQDNES